MNESKYKNKNKFIRRLNKWYKDNKRHYSWRKTNNPYYIGIAEILLQKTNADKVEPVYTRLINNYPKPRMLSNEKVKNIKHYFDEIGIFNRAETLINFATFMSETSSINIIKSELLEVKGIGLYMANSIIIHSKDKPLPLLDPNIIRLYNRVYGIKSILTRPRTDIKLWQESQKLLPSRNISSYYYALLDFGAIVCESRKPKCDICPMAFDICDRFFFENI